MVRRNRASRRKMRRAGVEAGRTYKNLVGTRAEVMHGTAFKTSYGRTKSQDGDALTRRDLKYNKHGRIVSVEKSSKKNKLLKQLRDAGYTTKKGKFGAVKTAKKGRKSSRGRKGRRKSRRKTKRCRHKSGRKKGKFKKC
tara:strand:+ start:256 stop:672 length:417 start_codon:yes stop_codon:yes gene_type:complete